MLPLIARIVLGIGLAGGLWWVSHQLQQVGALSSKIEAQSALLGELGTQNEALRSQIDGLAQLYADRERRMRGIETAFSELRAANQEIIDACTAEPLPAAYLDRLRVGAELAAGGLPDGAAAPAGTD